MVSITNDIAEFDIQLIVQIPERHLHKYLQI